MPIWAAVQKQAQIRSVLRAGLAQPGFLTQTQACPQAQIRLLVGLQHQLQLNRPLQPQIQRQAIAQLPPGRTTRQETPIVLPTQGANPYPYGLLHVQNTCAQNGIFPKPRTAAAQTDLGLIIQRHPHWHVLLNIHGQLKIAGQKRLQGRCTAGLRRQRRCLKMHGMVAHGSRFALSPHAGQTGQPARKTVLIMLQITDRLRLCPGSEKQQKQTVMKLVQKGYASTVSKVATTLEKVLRHVQWQRAIGPPQAKALHIQMQLFILPTSGLHAGGGKSQTRRLAYPHFFLTRRRRGSQTGLALGGLQGINGPQDPEQIMTKRPLLNNPAQLFQRSLWL